MDTNTQTQEVDNEVDTEGVKASEAELVAQINKWMNESITFHEALKRIQDENERYYLGDQTRKQEIPRFNSNAVQNHIFMGIETIIPIALSNPAKFIAQPAQENENSDMLSDAVEKVLSAQYDLKDVPMKLRQALRYMLIYRLGCMKIYWDETIDDVNCKPVRPQRIYIPDYGTTVDEIPYIIEKVDMTFKEIEDFFGAEGLLKAKGFNEKEEDVKLDKVRTIWEVWTDEWVAWKCGSEILKKMPNPTWDWTGEAEDGVDELKFYNHFSSPKKPYILKSLFTLGTSIVGETDLIQQSIPLQDIINTHLRQIINNATKMGNATWLIDSSVMEEEKADKITNAAGLKIIGEGVANPNLVRRDTPPALPNYIVNSKNQAENAFDNIFGTHSTTRGERTAPETLGGRILLKQADAGRIGDITSVLESMIAELGNWFVQMMKVYYVNKRTFRLFGESGVTFVNLSRDNIEDGLEIIVKSGSTLPKDEVSKANEALQLWQMGAIDPITLYEKLRFSNPREAAERLVAWQTGRLIPNQFPAVAQPAQPRQPSPEATQPASEVEMQALAQQGKQIGGI